MGLAKGGFLSNCAGVTGIAQKVALEPTPCAAVLHNVIIVFFRTIMQRYVTLLGESFCCPYSDYLFTTKQIGRAHV